MSCVLCPGLGPLPLAAFRDHVWEVHSAYRPLRCAHCGDPASDAHALAEHPGQDPMVRPASLCD